MKPVRSFSLLFVLFAISLCRAAEPPVTDLYMKALVAGVKNAIGWQSDDGRYNRSAQDKNQPVQDLLATTQMAIYPVAFLYANKHPLNPYYNNEQTLKSVLAEGDYLAAYKPVSFWPLSDWILHSWLSAMEQLGDKLDPERRARWSAAIEHWIKYYVEYLEMSRGKRLFTAVQLGTSPNHYSYYLASVMKAGEVLGHPQWRDMAREQFANLVRSQNPDGFWAEHDGPVNRYSWMTMQGVGLYYEMTRDPEAIEAIRRGKDFLLGFTYPDGSAVSVIDERNRYAPGLSATHGLLGLGHIADGRRFCRLTAEKMAAGADDEEGYGLSMESLSNLADAYHYWEPGPEAAVPWDSENYDRVLVSGARLMRRGDWVVTLSGIISPPWEGNQYFLDRYTYLEVWNRRTGLVIGGGLTKGQPQIATLLMQPSNGGDYFWPRESRIVADGDSMTLELSLDHFRAKLITRILNNDELVLHVHFIETSPPILWPNRYECNLQLQVKAGQQLTMADGEHVLGREKATIWEPAVGGKVETDKWVLEVPAGRSSFRFPFMPYFNYDVDGIGGPGSAVGILSTASRIDQGDLEYRLRIK